MILKAREHYTANQTKNTEDLFRAAFPRVQAIIPNTITGHKAAFASQMAIQTLKSKLMSPRLQLEVDSPAKHAWRDLVQGHRNQVTGYSWLAQQIPCCPHKYFYLTSISIRAPGPMSCCFQLTRGTYDAKKSPKMPCQHMRTYKYMYTSLQVICTCTYLSVWQNPAFLPLLPCLPKHTACLLQKKSILCQKSYPVKILTLCL